MIVRRPLANLNLLDKFAIQLHPKLQALKESAVNNSVNLSSGKLFFLSTGTVDFRRLRVPFYFR